MIHGLIITTLICLGVSNNLGAVDNTAPIFNQDNKTTIKQPLKNINVVDGKYTYEFESEYTTEINNIIDLNAVNDFDLKLLTTRKDATQNNDIFNLKTNTYLQNVFYQNEQITEEYTNGAWIYTRSNTNGKFNNAVLEIYQITPYRTTYDNYLQIQIENRITNNFGENVKLKKITYITTENLSRYIDATTINNEYWIGNIETTITNPGTGYNYQRKEEIITLQQKENGGGLNQNLEPTKYELTNNTTNYILIFYYLDPTIQDNYTGNITNYNNFYTTNKYGFILYKNLKTYGNFIPPVANYEVVDIPNFIFTILTLPFSFISVAFNLTLFPGTMYQINLANLFLAIIGILVFIFVIGLLIKKH